jgi:hypothetical protein
MDVTLGPWKAEMAVDAKLREPLVAAMAAAAMEKAKGTPGVTPKEATLGKPAKSGFTISGRVTSAVKQGADLVVSAVFTAWVDGTFANMKEVPGSASASGSMGAEDAVRAVTESRVKTILEGMKNGTVKKAR